jgi:hypothetical protein
VVSEEESSLKTQSRRAENGGGEKMKNIILVVILLVVFVAECDAVEIVVSDTIASKYVTKAGSIIGKGPVNQSMIGLDVAGFYGYVLNNYDFTKKKVNENDLILGKKITMESSFGIFSADVSYQRWFEEKENENIAEVALKYKGYVNGSVIWTKQVTEGMKLDKNRIYLELGKSIPYKKLTIMPSVATAFLDNFYSSTGWAHVTGRMRMEYFLDSHISLFAQGNFQKGLMHGKKDMFYSSSGVKFTF